MENEKIQTEIGTNWAEIGRKIDISPTRYPEFVQLAESLVRRQEIPENKHTDLLWTEDEAQRVAKFLKSLPEPQKIVIKSEKAPEEETQDEESYHWSARKRGVVIQKIVFDLLNRFGFYTSTYPLGGLRASLESSNYSPR